MGFRFLSDKWQSPQGAGKKAANLNEMAQAGLPVPDGFLVPASLLMENVTDAELAAAIERIGGFPVAVRSSGSLEDLPGASFAGQYVTVLDVGDLMSLRQAVGECRASIDRENVRSYLRQIGLADAKPTMAVLVQRMIEPRCSGVAFSIHPLTGREEHALVELCLGLGEKLVSGHVRPTQLVLDLRDGRLVEETPGDDGASLEGRHLAQMREMLLRVPAHFGSPLDIEWAIDRQDRFWLLQARPITKINWRTDVEEMTNADLKDGGVSARVCSPMMWSLYRDAFNDSMQGYTQAIRLLPRSAPMQPWISYYYGRVYWNANTVKRLLLKVPGFSEESFDRDLGIQKSYGPRGPAKVPFTVGTVLRALPIAWALARSYRRTLKNAAAYGAGFEPRESWFRDRIKEFGSTDDRTLWADFLELDSFQLRTEQDYFTTIFNNSNAQSDFKSLIERIDRKTRGATDLVRLLGGLSAISHLRIQDGVFGLHKLARERGFESSEYLEAEREFVRENDYHGDAELELTTPRWGEAPERIRELVQGMIRSGNEPSEPARTAELQKRHFEQERRAVIARLRLFGGPWGFVTARSFESSLRRTREFLVARELMRDYSTRCYYLYRLYLLELGARLERSGVLRQSAEIFMLHRDELRDLLASGLNGAAMASTDLQVRVRERRLHGLGMRDLTAPNEFGHGVRQRDEESYSQGEPGSVRLTGLGCSSGVVEGVVRVIDSIDQVGHLCKGEILVTRFTDPGWTPALGLVSGVVTEVGGLLSHAAVIGRELGIPAVLNLPGAARRLRTGQRVRINGSTGVVEVLEGAS